MTRERLGAATAWLAVAIAAVACDRAPRPRGAPVEVRIVHELGNARVRADLGAHPQLTVRYVAADGEHDPGRDAGAATFVYALDGGVPARQAHAARLSPGTYRIEACLEDPGGDGCTRRPADYLASPALSGQTLFVVPEGGGTITVRWGNLNPAAPDAAADAAVDAPVSKKDGGTSTAAPPKPSGARPVKKGKARSP